MHPKPGNTQPIPWKFFVLAFAITWLIWSPGLLANWKIIELRIPFIVFFFLGTWGPFLSASWLTYRRAGRPALLSFWKRGFAFKFSPVWLLVILLLALLVSAVPLGVHLLLGGPAPRETLLSQPVMILAVFMTYFLTGGGNEEWGWRGYALGPLQERWNPTAASLFLGVIWGLWHLPLFYIDGTGQSHMSFWVFMLAAPALSILHSWIYNKTGQSLLAVWLFHAAVGASWDVFPIVQPDLPGYQNVYLYDFGALILLAAAAVLISGTQLGLSVRRSPLGSPA